MNFLEVTGMKPMAVFFGLLVTTITMASSGYSADQKLKVGVVVPLSGDMAEFGEAAQHGLQIAVSDIPELSARFDFIYEDSRYDPAKSVSAIQKLINIDHVKLLLLWGEYPALATMKLIEDAHVPAIVLALDSDEAKGKDYIIRMFNAANDYVQPMLSYLRENGHRKIGIIFAEDPYFVRLIDAMRKNLGPDDELASVEQVSFDQSDFRSIIARMKSRGVDAVAVYLMPGQGSTFFRQAAAMQFKAQFFGADTFESETEIAAAEGAMEGAVYAHNSATDDFRQRYFKLYGNDHQLPYAAISYASGEILADAIPRLQPEMRPEEMMAVFRKAPGIESKAVGYFRVTSAMDDTYFRFPVVVKEIRGLSGTVVY